MGTRADFYVGRGEDAEWIGSIAWDGYPSGITPNTAERKPQWPGGSPLPVGASWPEGEHLFDATDEATYRERVARFFQYRDDVTLPEQGWPWPWETSHTTDYAYAFDGHVWGWCSGPWFDAREPEPDDWDEETETEIVREGLLPAFPDMSSRMNVQFGGKRSGLIVVSTPDA